MQKKQHLPLYIQILLAIGLAIPTGILFKAYVPYIEWVGTLFLNGLKLAVIPLIFSSIITGMVSMGSGENFGRISLKTISFYVITTIIAGVIGLLSMNIFQPGKNVSIQVTTILEIESTETVTFQSIINQLVPSNLFKAFIENNLLGVLVFAVLLGFSINKLTPQRRDSLKSFFDSLFHAMLNMINLILKIAPFGVFAITANIVAKQTEMGSFLTSLGGFMMVVLLGLFIHALVVLPVILYSFRINGYKHLFNMKNTLLTAFSTSSSNATLPVAMNDVEELSGVSNKITSFTLPLGSTINMNGTALYECVTAMFIAQVYGIDLSITQQIIIVFTALLSAIGTPGMPMASLVTMSIVLTAVGLPLEGISLIIAVDRIMDMFRTTVNVFGDTCGAVVVAKTEGETLRV